MKHKFEQKVYYADTDAYGVVWHGSYIRWLEIGRIELCDKMGYSLVELEAKNIVLPVVNINVRYKSSFRLNDKMIIETWIQKFNPLSVTFEQKILNKETGKTFVEAVVECVAIDNNGKLYRKMPQILLDAFEKIMKEENEEYAAK